jgi:hypothetical protein
MERLRSLSRVALDLNTFDFFFRCTIPLLGVRQHRSSGRIASILIQSAGTTFKESE